MLDKIHNPFVNNLAVRYTEVVTAMTENGIITESYQYELDESIKLYTCKANREYMFTKLSMYARDMLLAMCYYVNHEYTYVIISYEKVLSLYGTYSKRRYDDTIRELIKHGVLDYKSKADNQYWYNPIYFASGNRLKMYPECAVKVNTVHR